MTVAACGADKNFDDDPTSAPPTSTGPIGAANVPLVDSIDVAGSRAAMEAGHAEIREILEAELGTSGWWEARPAQEVSCPSRADESGDLGDGIGIFYATELNHPEHLDADTWAAVWDEIVGAVESHGFRSADSSEEGSGADGAYYADGAHYEYLTNEHGDQLTVSTHPTIGTGYGGFGVCHPWAE